MAVLKSQKPFAIHPQDYCQFYFNVENHLQKPYKEARLLVSLNHILILNYECMLSGINMSDKEVIVAEVAAVINSNLRRKTNNCQDM